MGNQVESVYSQRIHRLSMGYLLVPLLSPARTAWSATHLHLRQKNYGRSQEGSLEFQESIATTLEFGGICTAQKASTLKGVKESLREQLIEDEEDTEASLCVC